MFSWLIANRRDSWSKETFTLDQFMYFVEIVKTVRDFNNLSENHLPVPPIGCLVLSKV
jgi:hypothetical protein